MSKPRSMTSPLFQVRVSVSVAAAPVDVYAVVSDLPRSGEWSAECQGGTWVEGAAGEVGSVFRGVNFRTEDAVASARRMIQEGAAIVDVGGESTRPGSDGVSVDEELRRVVPVLEALAGRPVSIDTSKAEVARRALELGAELVNDVTALRGDPALAEVVAAAGAYLCLMHM